MLRKRRDASKLSTDVWGQISSHLIENPRRVFMILCTIKGLKFTHEWWAFYWERHKLYLQRKNHSPHWFIKLVPRRPGVHKVILKLVYGLFCESCGCRYHHRIFVPFNMRLCCECKRDRHISNVVLWKDYGIKLQDIVPYRHFVRFHSFQRYLCPKQILHLSHDPRDVGYFGTRFMIFFWKSDLEKFFPLAEMQRAQLLRVSSLNIIKAAFKRAFAQKQKRRYLVEYLHSNEVARLGISVHSICWDKRSLADYLRYFEIKGVPKLLADHEFTLKTAASRLSSAEFEQRLHDWGPFPEHLVDEIFS
jgi:hypothetical protein